MTRKSNKQKKEERVIYLLLSPNRKIFYINHCLKNSLKETYRHNLKLRREMTKEFIKELQPERPCLFVLENVFCTNQEAINLIVPWVKIFLENGYKSYNHPTLLEMAEHLYFDNKFRYAERNNLELQKITMYENCQMPIYNRQACNYYPENIEIKED